SPAWPDPRLVRSTPYPAPALLRPRPPDPPGGPPARRPPPFGHTRPAPCLPLPRALDYNGLQPFLSAPGDQPCPDPGLVEPRGVKEADPAARPVHRRTPGILGAGQ